MKNPLSEHALKEIGERRRVVLEAAGLDTLEALAAADPEVLAELQGFYRALGERVVARAAERLQELEVPVEPAPAPAPPGPDPEVRQRVQGVLDHLHEARRHTRAASSKKRGRKARRSLKGVRQKLEHLYARVLGGEVAPKEWRKLAPRLEALDAGLRRFLRNKPRKARLSRVRKAAKKAGKKL